jgi:hypothetical protein
MQSGSNGRRPISSLGSQLCLLSQGQKVKNQSIEKQNKNRFIFIKLIIYFTRVRYRLIENDR